KLSLFQQRRHCGLWNEVIPVLLNIVQNALHVWAEVHAHGVTGDFVGAHAGSWLTLAQTQVSVITAISPMADGRLARSLIDCATGRHRLRIKRRRWLARKGWRLQLCHLLRLSWRLRLRLLLLWLGLRLNLCRLGLRL